jgi:hypothetical protein
MDFTKLRQILYCMLDLQVKKKKTLRNCCSKSAVISSKYSVLCNKYLILEINLHIKY